MLSLLIVFMLFATLLPLMQKMHQTLDDKSLRVTAFETMHEAAKVIQSTDADAGKRTINEVLFTWEYNSQLCVSYTNNQFEHQTICHG